VGAIGRVKVIVVDRTRMGFLKEAQDLYLGRLSHYTSLEWIEVKPMRYKKGLNPERILDKEASLIRKKIDPVDYVIVLDRQGRTYSSEEFASHLERLFHQGRPILFLIGGPLGIQNKLLETAHETISLSSMTLTHEWSRVLLLEQVYRAFTIIRGESYHK